jgi:NAD(P)-dependent dehydrogenase (short-subunit alcohol dehydrogenase family)
MSSLMFDGDVVIVTGAGAGLGRAYALELGRRGARVLVNDLGADPSGGGSSPNPAAATVDAIRAAGGVAEANQDSVADPEGGSAIVRAALDAWGRVDAVVHNAGFTRDNHFAEMTTEEIEAVVGVHLLGGFYVAQPAFAAMQQSGGGRFVLTTSAAGLLGAPLMSNYAAAKMGVVGLVRSLAVEGRQYGIKANAISPGAATRRADDPDAFRFRARAEPLDPTAMPAREWLTPERVAPMVAVLCHPSCPVTGEVFLARAGWFSRAWIVAGDGWVAGPDPFEAEDVLEHWEEIYGSDATARELPLDGPGWAYRFLSERIVPLLESGSGT